MLYISTRGNSPEVSFITAITQGLAPDGGLYVPKTWPKLSDDVLKAAASAPYFETAAQVLKAFAGDDLDLETARAICKSAYGEQWESKDIVPLREIAPHVHLLELFHGPSLAFKDVAMQMIGALYEYILEKSGKKLSVICATSGDTGGAAVEALKNRKNIELFVLMPDGRVSEVQRLFMTASGGKNVHSLVLDGDFDQAQAILKNLFTDKAFVAEVNLTPVNSVNFARIVAQSVYFITAAAKFDNGKATEFVVPTGNFGDALSGFVAKKLGANIGKITIANNANNSTAIALQTGEFSIGSHSHATISPAMDIQVPSNFERILYELGEDDEDARATAINAAYKSLKENKEFSISEAVMNNLHQYFGSSYSDDDATRKAIIDCKNKTGEVICPHTAVGWDAIAKAGNGEKVLLATAHAAKFPETTLEVLGIHPALPNHAKDLFERKEIYDKMTATEDNIKNYLRAKVS